MSFVSAIEGLFSTAEKAIAPYEPLINVGEQIVENVAPVVAAAVPAAAPEITAVQAAIAKGRAIVAAATPEVLDLLSVLDSLFTLHQAGQSAIVVPNTTAPTTNAAIAPAPGAALS